MNNSILNSVEVDLNVKTSDITKVKIKEFLDLFFENVNDEQFLEEMFKFVRKYNSENKNKSNFKYVSGLIVLD